jgi:pyruvate carboxylase
MPQQILCEFLAAIMRDLEPDGGSIAALEQLALERAHQVVHGRPSDGLPPFDLGKATQHVADRTGREPVRREVISYALYPRVLDDFFAFQNRCGDVSLLAIARTLSASAAAGATRPMASSGGFCLLRASGLPTFSVPN